MTEKTENHPEQATPAAAAPTKAKAKKDDTPDYQKRVKVELDDLNDKVAKLTAFLNEPENPEGMDLMDRGLLIKQLDIMRRYALILDQRIARF